jgi:hypothetical protein
MKPCALLTGSTFQFVDHIAPLASLAQMPLVVTDPDLRSLVEIYYPEIELRYLPYLAYQIRGLTQEFDLFFTCDFWTEGMKKAFQSTAHHPIHFGFCPHGLSEKGFAFPSLQPYREQPIVLLYGELMKTMLETLGLLNSNSIYRYVGNYRFEYYRQHQNRLDQIVESQVFSKFTARRQTTLYAPTWQDFENSSSFFNHVQSITERLPTNQNLIIKLHPLLERDHPALFHRLALEERGNLVILDQFPWIYPILERVDRYLGDYSSIGYDVLSRPRPMFFLPKAHLGPTLLQRCGHVLKPGENPFDVSVDVDQELIKALYQRGFEIHHRCCRTAVARFDLGALVLQTDQPNVR